MAQTEYLTAPLKTDKMPPGVRYIVWNEAAERFSYYGMSSILVVFMTTYLLNAQGKPDLFNEQQAKAWFHTFVSLAYFLPFFGAILADAILGKYRTILILSVVYCCGHLTLALEHTRVGLVIGLGLIAMGAGGIKPCVSANVGDQFGPSNQHLLTRVFSWFYFSINIGSAVSIFLIPLLLDPYKAAPDFAANWPMLSRFLEKTLGPDIAFGIPGLLMLIATIIFWMGRKKFVHLPPAGLRRYVQEIFTLENLKTLGNLLILVPFVAVFWGLWQQNSSACVFQAERMNRHLFGIEWKPAQIQMVNPLFILLMLPVFSYFVYPTMERFFRVTPLRKIGIGLFVMVAAFAILGRIQTRIDAGQTPHVLWQILAFLVLTISEVMVSVTHLEFAYTQAPKKLKSLVMCTYLGAISLGNAFTAGINFLIENKTLNLEGARYYFFFFVVMIVTSLLFGFFARFYRGKTYIQDEAE